MNFIYFTLDGDLPTICSTSSWQEALGGIIQFSAPSADVGGLGDLLDSMAAFYPEILEDKIERSSGNISNISLLDRTILSYLR